MSVLFHADINECTRKIDSCDELCINTPGSYRCDCPAGFELQYDQQSCADIDECARGTSSCSQACINTHGSFRCECSFGYTLSPDSQTCVGKFLSNYFKVLRKEQICKFSSHLAAITLPIVIILPII